MMEYLNNESETAFKKLMDQIRILKQMYSEDDDIWYKISNHINHLSYLEVAEASVNMEQSKNCLFQRCPTGRRVTFEQSESHHMSPILSLITNKKQAPNPSFAVETSAGCGVSFKQSKLRHMSPALPPITNKKHRATNPSSVVETSAEWNPTGRRFERTNSSPSVPQIINKKKATNTSSTKTKEVPNESHWVRRSERSQKKPQRF